MELVSLQFRFCDVFMTSCIYIAFWHIMYRKLPFFCFWTVFRRFSWTSPWTCPHRQLPCRSLSPSFLIFDAVSCYFCGFLWCNEGWILCISFNLTSDFLLNLMFYRSFDRIFLCKSCHWNCFYVAVNWVFRCTLTSCFSISFWIFLDRCN